MPRKRSPFGCMAWDEKAGKLVLYNMPSQTLLYAVRSMYTRLLCKAREGNRWCRLQWQAAGSRPVVESDIWR